ncbi:hypothetical protein B0H14DRAFT_3131984 [Mycena olivaceomarginata]|nr:hypothetical protein B0H14DRAFT_3131984 [Mycena olivaceomarginata]
MALTWHLSLSHTFTMPSAAFCNKPLSTSVNSLSENLGVTLNLILSNGIQAPHSLTSSLLTLPSGDTVCFMKIDLLVCSELPYDWAEIDYSFAARPFHTNLLLFLLVLLTLETLGYLFQFDDAQLPACFIALSPHALNLSIVDIDTPVSWVMQSESTEYLGFAQFWCQAIQ